MKKYIFLLILINSILGVTAQTPYFLKNMSWSPKVITEDSECENRYLLDNDVITNLIECDTIIEGVYYQCYKFGENIDNFIFIRQENNKIYGMYHTPIDNIEEALLCDFNLNKGDVLQSFNSYVVDSVTYITIADDKTAKIIYYDNVNSDYYRLPDIEFVGNMAGLLYGWFDFNNFSKQNIIGSIVTLDNEDYFYAISDSLMWCDMQLKGMPCDTYFDIDMQYTFSYSADREGKIVELPNETQLFEGYKIINGKRYIYRSFENDRRPSWIGGKTYIRAEGNKVYALINGKGDEYLLYDFDLQVGDKILTNKPLTWDDDEYATVTEINTIMLPDGREARMLKYDHRIPDIEYVGSLCGIINPLEDWLSIVGDLGVGLLCVQKKNCKEDYVIYESTLGCDYEPQIDVIENVNINQNAEFKIYPVPATDIINVEVPDLLKVDIYNELGQKVITTSKSQYDLSNIPNGTYLVKIYTKDNKEYHSKIIKN